MKIEEGSIFFSGSHDLFEKQINTRKVQIEVSRLPRPTQEKSSIEPAKTKSITEQIKDEIDLDPKALLIKLIIEKILKKKIKVVSQKELKGDHKQDDNQNKLVNPQSNASSIQIRIQITSKEIHFRSEKSSFTAQGNIRTADGEEISFNLTLHLSSQFLKIRESVIQAGNTPQKKDPLIVNFDGSIDNLNGKLFTFDLDADGITENIFVPGPMSGFLAFDKNKDGIINNGTELFGPVTGEGFNELAQYDADHNQWIDENDPIYDSLKIWQPLSQDNNLTPISKNNIQAIYLGHLATPFSYRDLEDSILAQLRSTSIYLGAGATAGTIQQVDLFA